MTTMLELKGHDYVATFADRLASQTGISVEYVAEAIKAVTGVSVDRFGLYETAPDAIRNPVLEVVGALTPDQGRAVVAEMRRIKAEIADVQKTHCWCCGQQLRNGVCPACGDI